MLEQETLTTPVSAPRRRSRRPWGLIGVALVVVLVAAVLGFNRHWFQSAEANTNVELFTVERRSFPVVLQEKGELEAANKIVIRSELEGRATIIFLVDEGTHVKKGDLLVELASDEIQERIRDAEIRVTTAEAAYEAAVKEHEILLSENASKLRKAQLALEMATLDLKRYEEGERVQLQQDAELALDKAENVLKRAQEFYEDSKDLHAQGFITKIELENDEFEAYEAGIALKKAKKALEVLEKYTIPMDLREKQSAVEEAKKELEREHQATAASQAKSEADVQAKQSELQLVKDKLAKLKDQMSKSRITAPADGLVVYASDGWHRRETSIEQGQQVYERQEMIELPDTSKMKVLVRVHEAQTEYLKLGARATVEVEGYSGRQFTGSVTKIAVLADSQNRWLNPNLKEYETEIMLDGEFKDLKPGATSHVRIWLAQVDDALAVPVQAVFSRSGKYFVFVEDGAALTPREVTVGLSSNEYVEITDGLASGDQVRLAVTDDEKRLLPEEKAKGDDKGELARPSNPSPQGDQPAGGRGA